MSKKKKERFSSTGKYDAVMESPIALTVIGILAILFGIFFMVSQTGNKPVERAEALSYSGDFEKYEVWRNSREIHFKDGSIYQVYPHTEKQDFYDAMMALEKGTVLYLLINPNNEYVAEVRTDKEELLNFEDSQKAIDLYDNGYIGIGIFACVAGAFLILYGVFSHFFKKKESNRQKQKAKKRIKGQSDTALREFCLKQPSAITKSATAG